MWFNTPHGTHNWPAYFHTQQIAAPLHKIKIKIKITTMAKGLVVFLCFVLLVSMTAATEFKAGGTGQWKVPESGAKTYNQWAEANRFKIGDTVGNICCIFKG
jgi:hypothetical protein